MLKKNSLSAKCLLTYCPVPDFPFLHTFFVVVHSYNLLWRGWLCLIGLLFLEMILLAYLIFSYHFRQRPVTPRCTAQWFGYTDVLFSCSVISEPFVTLWIRLYIHVQLLSHSWGFCDPVDCTRQAPLSMGFPRPEHCGGLPFPSPGDLPDRG